MGRELVHCSVVISSIVLYVMIAKTSEAAIPPTIVNFPARDMDQPDDVKSSFQIPCQAAGTAPFTWVWKKFSIDDWNRLDNDGIKSDKIIYTISAEGLLTGRVFENAADGFYQCFVSNSAGTTFSRKIKVKATTVKEFVVSSDVTVDVTLGRKKVIKCPPRGKGFGVSYDWGRFSQLDGFKSLGTTENRIITSEGDLIFSYITQQDIDDVSNIGGLQCRIEAGRSYHYSHVIRLNKVGSAYNGTTAPNFAVSLGETYNATEGRSIALYCAATGKPTPVITWLKDNQTIVDGKDSYKISKQLFSRNLEIEKVNKTLHEGQYECRATSSVSAAGQTTSGKLNVKVAPVITSHPGITVNVMYNGTLTLSCNASGDPTPRITWWMNGRPLLGTSDKVTLSPGTVKIRQVDKADEGSYQCVAENDISMVVSLSHVQVKNTTVVTQKPSDVRVVMGETAELHCKAKTDDSLSLQYKWLRNDEEIVYNDQVSWDKQKHVLKIENVQMHNRGKYTCVAYTPKPLYSQDTASAVLRIQGVPDPPRNLKISNCRTSNATLTWELIRLNGTTVTHFLIEQESNYEPGVFYAIANVTEPEKTSMELKLTLFANLTFRMKAFSGRLASLPSEPTEAGSCETKPAKPVVIPDNLRGTSQGPNTLTLLWDAILPQQQNGPGFFYYVRFKKTSDSRWTNATVYPPQTSYDVKNAGVVTKWQFQVWGENIEGDGPPSPVTVAVSGQDYPPPVKNVKLEHVTMESVNLTWDAVEPFKGIIDGYWIYHDVISKNESLRRSVKFGGRKQVPKTACLNSTCSGGVTGLATGTRYEVYLKAFNSRGEGAPSPKITFRTVDEVTEISEEPWWKKAWFIAVIVCLILLIILLLVCIICCCKRRQEGGMGKYDVVKSSEKEKDKSTTV